MALASNPLSVSATRRLPGVSALTVGSVPHHHIRGRVLWRGQISLRVSPSYSARSSSRTAPYSCCVCPRADSRPARSDRRVSPAPAIPDPAPSRSHSPRASSRRAARRDSTSRPPPSPTAPVIAQPIHLAVAAEADVTACLEDRVRRGRDPREHILALRNHGRRSAR